MADLDPLIRIRKHAVEQKQKFLAELYRQAEELESQKTNLLETLKAERQKVDEIGVEALGYFGHYSKAVNARVEDIDEAVKKINHRINMAREDVREAFADLKKIEITQERRKEQEKTKRDKKDADILDDIAIEGFRKRMDEEGN